MTPMERAQAMNEINREYDVAIRAANEKFNLANQEARKAWEAELLAAKNTMMERVRQLELAQSGPAPSTTAMGTPLVPGANTITGTLQEKQDDRKA